MLLLSAESRMASTALNWPFPIGWVASSTPFLQKKMWVMGTLEKTKHRARIKSPA